MRAEDVQRQLFECYSAVAKGNEDKRTIRLYLENLHE